MIFKKLNIIFIILLMLVFNFHVNGELESAKAISAPAYSPSLPTSYHYINSFDPEHNSVTLDDSSLWEYDKKDNVIINSWYPTDPVFVVVKLTLLAYDASLYNIITNETVKVSKLSNPRNSPFYYTIANVQDGIIQLTDGKKVDDGSLWVIHKENNIIGWKTSYVNQAVIGVTADPDSPDALIIPNVGSIKGKATKSN